MKKTILTDNDYNFFYKSLVFGKVDNPIKSAVSGAYMDFRRTITGFAKNKNHDKILEKSKELLFKEIESMLNRNILIQSEFDEWHKLCCEKLIKIFENQKFYYGQAQKWINMSLKNLSMLNHKLVEKKYEFFHIPIDNYIIKITGKKLSSAWSRISSYDEYLEFQNDFRNNYSGIPLDNEFKLWLKAKEILDE